MNIKVASPLFGSDRNHEEAHSNSYEVEELELVQPQIIGATVVSSKFKTQLEDINAQVGPSFWNGSKVKTRNFNQENVINFREKKQSSSLTMQYYQAL